MDAELELCRLMIPSATYIGLILCWDMHIQVICMTVSVI